MIDLAKMVERMVSSGYVGVKRDVRQGVPAIAWANGDRPESVKLVCIGWVNGDTVRDYVRYQDDDAYPPLLWRKPSRHADQPVYVIGREET